MFGVPLSALVANAALPPFSLVLMLAAGLLIHPRAPRLALTLIALATATLYALSTPWVSSVLQKSLEVADAVDLAAPPQADAIVVLGGGERTDAPEYGGDTQNALSLERLRYAARLYQATHLPILATGGKSDSATLAEGTLMRAILIKELHTPVRWVEDASRTTWDNAHLSAPILKHAGIKRIFLVSHAWHLRRAVPLFEQQGLQVIPAGINFSRPRFETVLDILPGMTGLRDSTYALHEWLGILWYHFRQQQDTTS